MLSFYQLFAHANQQQAVLMVILGGPVAASLYFVNVLNDAAALALIRSGHFLTVFTTPQLHAAAFFKRIEAGQAFPFEVRVPNATTLGAMQAGDRGEVTRFKTVEALMADLYADDSQR